MITNCLNSFAIYLQRKFFPLAANCELTLSTHWTKRVQKCICEARSVHIQLIHNMFYNYIKLNCLILKTTPYLCYHGRVCFQNINGKDNVFCALCFDQLELNRFTNHITARNLLTTSRHIMTLRHGNSVYTHKIT